MVLSGNTKIELKDKLDNQIKELNSKDIAIIGLSAKLPMADDAETYWENILNKVECIKEFPIERKKNADKYLKFKGINSDKRKYFNANFLDNIDEFDAKLFHLSPKEVKLMDPRQRLFLQYAWEAIEDAGYNPTELRGQRIGVYSGISSGETSYYDILTEINPNLSSIGVSGNMPSIIPSRVSYILDLKGPSIVVDTACSSSLVAIHLACKALRNNDCESAIVGSVRLNLIPLISQTKVGFESEDGTTRAFDDSAEGTGLGEGVICVILKSLNKAQEDGNHIYAVIKGTAINQDGNSVGITAPNADAQADVIERAWEDADIFPEDISYIETHGTGTALGDPIEINGIRKAFSKYTSKEQFCAIGSVKSNIGHLYEAAGLASLIKCIFALNEKLLPPSINYKIPNKLINFIDSPVYVNIETRKWESGKKKRICGISSFGLSGTNCHIVLEEADNEKKVVDENLQGSYLLILSGKTVGIVKELIRLYLKNFNYIITENPKDVCYTASVGRNHYKYRVAIIFSNYEELKEHLLELSQTPLEKLIDTNIFSSCIQNKNTDTKADDANNQCNSNTDYDTLNTIDLNTENDKNRLRLIANAYINNEKIKWADLYKSSKRKRTKLPSWVFEQDSYWIDIPDIMKESITINCKDNSINKGINEILLEGRADGEYTITERRLGSIVKEIMEYKKINIYENFYELGGDSLLAMNMYTKINEYFKISITVADIFSYPSIALLSKHIDQVLSKKQNITHKLGDDNTLFTDVEKDIAIIGMGGKFPLSDSIDEYWQNMCDKKNCIGDIPSNRKFDLKNYLRHLGLDEETVRYQKAGYLREIDKFDYEYFGLSLKEAVLMNPIQRMLLEVVYETIENAGYGGKRLVGSKTGVFIGYIEEYIYNYMRFIYESDPSLTEAALQGNLTSIISGRISYALDLKGPSMVIDTACSSSLVALNTAIKSLKNGECETAIVGGAKINLVPIYDPKSNFGVESNNFSIRPFDDNADGIVQGEAICTVMLKPLKKAEADGDNIRAVIKGSAVNQDGTGMGIMAPSAENQSKVIIDAWKDAGVDPSTITYVETHGTGTKLGDLIEYEALKKAFFQYTDKRQFCAISSLKSNIGHTYQASGIASLIKAVLSLENRKLIPTINFSRPNRLIDFEDSPLYVNDMQREWEEDGLTRRCGISSFGLSGTNCHVILEEYLKEEFLNDNKGCYIVTLSAKDDEALKNIILNYKRFLDSNEIINIGQLSYTANVGRGHYKKRIAFIIKDRKDFTNKLSQLCLQKLDDFNIQDVFYGEIDKKYTIPKNINSYFKNSYTEIINNIDRLREKENIDISALREICAIYVTGAEIPWESLYEENKRKIITLPTYPFTRKKCWFQPTKMRIEKLSVDGSMVINDYEALENIHEEEKQQGMESDSKIDFIENKEDVENIIIKAIKQIIKVHEVSPKDNFFELGGNSIKATVLASKIYELLGVLIPLSSILSYPTIKDLSEHIKKLIEDNSQNNSQSIPILPEEKYYDLSLKQLDLWLSAKVYEDASALNITWASMLYNFDIQVLYKTLEALINRHQIMKTRLVVIDSVPKQTISEFKSTESFCKYLDISKEENIDNVLMEILQKQVDKQFSLEKDPLIRITIIKLDNNKHALIFIISHIISDWWSIDVIVNDFKKYYKAFILDEDPKLAPISLKYSDFAVWHKNRVEGSKGNLKKYWDEVLHGPLPILEMRTDFERPLIKGQVGKSLNFNLNKEVTDKLRSIADLNQGTQFMTMLASVFTLLYMYSGQNDIIVGVNTSGREHPQLANQVGYFINVLPLRLTTEGNDNFNQLFKKVRKVVLGALEHQDYPFNLMLDNKSVIRDSSRSPIFDVMVQYLNDPNASDIVVNAARIEQIEYDSLESKYDLIFNFIEGKEQIVLQLEYSNNLFKEETIKRMVKRLNKILEAFSKDQQQPINRIKIEDKQSKSIKLIKRTRG